MNFRVDRWSRSALCRSAVLAMAVAGSLMLASCGGAGTEDQSRQFDPTRIIVFGDEASLLLPPSAVNGVDGLKYTVNGFNPFTTVPNTVRDCRANLIWVQELAQEFDLVFAECNPNALPVSGQMRAAAGAKVADVVAQIDDFLATSSFVPDDLVTLMVGTHDIIEIYNSVSTGAITEAAAEAEAERRGRLVADQVDRITNRDNTRGRVIYVTVPDVSETPFGIGAPTGRTERVRLLRLISQRFNDRLRGTVTVNGRSIGSLNAFQDFRNIVDFVDDDREAAGFINATESVCTTVSVLDCTTLTLAPTPSGELPTTELNWLWASGFYFSPGGHAFIANEAIDLATNLPF